MIYYISDSHFFHERLNYHVDNRGFASAHEMNETMIAQWNHRVTQDDRVIILGDFSVGSGTQTNEVLARLAGHKCLISGNHDAYLDDEAFDTSLFEWIRPYEEISDGGKTVVVSHYPMICYHGQYQLDTEHRPLYYMLYGHVHDTVDQQLVRQYQAETRRTPYYAGLIPCHMYNCFCMYSSYVPWSLQEWVQYHENAQV
ncbi:MAG: phosphoesterase [Lachnospiraceae bacterium]